MAIHFISTEGWSREEWGAWRLRGLGASEIGMLLVPNPFECSLELFHRKIGLLGAKEMTFRMIEGHEQEVIISKYFEYWEKDQSGFLRNWNAGRKVNNVRDVHGYHYNDKYPFLFCSLDREYEDGDEWCPLELKDKTDASYAMFEEELNPMELSQLSTQILIKEASKGKLCYKVGGSRIEVVSMKNKDAMGMEKVIMKAAKDFWSKVEKARVVRNQIEYARINHNYKLEQELQVELYSLEPPPDDSKAYYNYLKVLTREKLETVPIKGAQDDLDMAKGLKKLEAKRKKIELEEIKLKSQLCNKMRVEGKLAIDFGKDGSVSFFGGRFKNKVA